MSRYTNIICNYAKMNITPYNCTKKNSFLNSPVIIYITFRPFLRETIVISHQQTGYIQFLNISGNTEPSVISKTCLYLTLITLVIFKLKRDFININWRNKWRLRRLCVQDCGSDRSDTLFRSATIKPCYYQWDCDL